MTTRRVIAVLGALLLFCVFAALGTWQVQRRAWKLDLIARTAARVHAPPTQPPPRAEWARVTAAAHEYRHIQATGVYLAKADVRVQALTGLGSGFWLLTPLRLSDGTLLLVNRGFVPPQWQDRAASTVGITTRPTTVTGLLRVSEPGGSLLRRNDPAADRWFSRDIPAIAAARGLHLAAPYFMDAEAGPQPTADADSPAAGLTVIAFHNNHAIYAITWYTLALMIPAAMALAIREQRRQRREVDVTPA